MTTANDGSRSAAAQFMAYADTELFTPTEPNTPTWSRPDLATFDGQLVQDAQVRSKTAPDGLHSVPVLCLELKATTPGDKRTCSAQLMYTDATRPQAEQRAKTLKKGMLITVGAQPHALRIVMPSATIIDSPSHQTATSS